MNRFKSLLAFLCLAVASLANAQVSDSTAIAGISGSAPTLDCASGQVKIGSQCNMTVTFGATQDGSCTKVGLLSMGVDASGALFVCINGAWKSQGGGAAATPTALPGCANSTIGTSPSNGSTAHGGYGQGCAAQGYMGNYTCTAGSWVMTSQFYTTACFTGL